MSGTGGRFDTEVDGEPGTLRDCVRWLRGTVRDDLERAASRQAGARRDAAGGWEGASCEAYRDVGAAALTATDDHAVRVGRAADDVAAVADRLDDLRDTMRGIRSEARGAGLLVDGTVVTLPIPPVGLEGLTPPVPDLSGGGGSEAARQQAAYDRLERRATSSRQRAEEWIAGHLADAGDRAAERGDVDLLRRRLGGPAPRGPVAAPDPVEVPDLGVVGGPGGSGGGSGGGSASAGGGGSLAGPGGAAEPPGGGGSGGSPGGRGPEGTPRWVPGPGGPRWERPRGEPRWDDPPRGRPRWDDPRGEPRWDDPQGEPQGEPQWDDPRGEPEWEGARGEPRWDDPWRELPVAEPGEVPVAEPGEVPVAEPGEMPVAEPGVRVGGRG